MKKKIIAVASAFCLSVASLGMVDLRVSAQENEKGQEDFSYLLTGDVIIGQMQPETKGVYLSSGTSIIKDAGSGKIVAGGITSAAIKCDVSVNVIVERLSGSNGRARVSGSNWVRVTSWTANENDAWTVGSSKNLTVGKGYYYRVRSVHYAHTDVSSSMTSSLWR